MRRVAVLLAVSLSAGAVFAQEPAKPADDRVPIPANIETWYRVEQNKEHVGWFHEKLSTTTMRNYRYDYSVESEYSYTTTSPSGEEQFITINEMLTAELEEDFDAYTLDYTLNFSGSQLLISLRTYSDSDERIVKVELKADVPYAREFKFPTSETIHYYLSPMLYRLRQSGSLAQPSRPREKVFIAGQDEPMSVNYTVGGLVDKEILGKTVKVSDVRLVGWDRGAVAPLSRIWVDKYGRIVEAESADKSMGLYMAKDQVEAVGRRKGIQMKGRRDPFAKTLTSPGDPDERKNQITKGDGKPTPDKLPKDQAELVKTIAETKALLAQLRDQVERQLNEEARATYLLILAHYRGMYKFAGADTLQKGEIEKVREDAETLYGGVAKLKAVIHGKVDRIQDLYLNDNIEGIERELAELKAFKDAPELFRNEDGTAHLNEAIRKAEKMREQTIARIELSKKVLVLTGTITATEVVQEVVKLDLYVAGARLAVAQPVSVRRMVTMAVINDEPYREGETVARENVKVVKIHRHAVEVEYKEEVRQVVLRK
jgi:hypothetical protein